jgi:RNA polymerase primary sigma factor
MQVICPVISYEAYRVGPNLIEPGGSVNRSSNPAQCRSLLSVYLKEISAYPLLIPEEEKRLGHLAQRGDEDAIQRLVEGNLRFVVKIAKKYHGLRLSLLDLIHEGNLGLIVAAKRFDPSRGVKFLSYAVWWIRQSILSAISNCGHAFRIPAKFSAKLFRINLALARLRELDAQPTIEELTAESGLAATEIELTIQLKRDTVSLHQPLSADGDRSLEDVLPDIKQSSVEQRLINDDLKRHLKSGVAQLSSREQQVLVLRFGLDGQEPRTLEEIGSQIGVCRERIRQIQVNAINKLRNNDEIQTLAVAL